MVVGKITPKPPVTWQVFYELSDQEKAAWLAFFYLMRDGQIVLPLNGATPGGPITQQMIDVWRNTASPLYELFKEGYLEPGP